MDRKTRKVLDIHENGTHIVCIRTADRYNHYKVYKVWAGHRKLLVKYGDFISVICFLKDFYLEGMDSMPYTEAVEQIKKRSI